MDKIRQIGEIMMAKADRPFNRVMVITGARQVGKTTIIQNYFSDYKYLSVEPPIIASNLKSLITSQWAMLYPQAALDEVQKEPILVEFIKAVYDKYKSTRYILTGSSQLLLLKKVRESLAGRCRIYDVYPLTLPELQTPSIPIHSSKWQKLLKGEENVSLPNFMFDQDYLSKIESYKYYLSYGGYPALVNEVLTVEERWAWLKDYVRTYLERDIRDLASFNDLAPFVKLQQALANQTGQTVTESSLANIIGTSPKTAKRYIEYLTISYQTISLPAWRRNVNKRLIRAPKVHFLDHGVLQAVLQRRGGLSGNEYESAIVSEIYKQAKNTTLDLSFYHLRTHEGREVDLLVETSDGYYAFEIKMADRIQFTDTRHLRNLSELVNDKPILHSYLLSNDPRTIKMTDTITAIHAAYFLG